MRPLVVVLAAAVGVAGLGCDAGRKSSAGFRLPDGDVARGRAAFVELKCNACHRVAGMDLPPPVAAPPVPVVLGGEYPRVRSDGELVTEIINPSHHIVPAVDMTRVTSGGGSRMADYGEAMTVRQLIDLVAFLHSVYTVQPPPMPGS
jgi:L-cysteine S-thiosulfotransferase